MENVDMVYQPKAYKTLEQYTNAFAHGLSTTDEGYRHYAELCRQAKQAGQEIPEVVVTRHGGHDPIRPQQQARARGEVAIEDIAPVVRRGMNADCEDEVPSIDDCAKQANLIQAQVRQQMGREAVVAVQRGGGRQSLKAMFDSVKVDEPDEVLAARFARRGG
jgi:hypothetical protein